MLHLLSISNPKVKDYLGRVKFVEDRVRVVEGWKEVREAGEKVKKSWENCIMKFNLCGPRGAVCFYFESDVCWPLGKDGHVAQLMDQSRVRGWIQFCSPPYTFCHSIAP